MNDPQKARVIAEGLIVATGNQPLYQTDAVFHAQIEGLAQLLVPIVEGLAVKATMDAGQRIAAIEKLKRTPGALTEFQRTMGLKP